MYLPPYLFPALVCKGAFLMPFCDIAQPEQGTGRNILERKAIIRCPLATRFYPAIVPIIQFVHIAGRNGIVIVPGSKLDRANLTTTSQVHADPQTKSGINFKVSQRIGIEYAGDSHCPGDGFTSYRRKMQGVSLRRICTQLSNTKHATRTHIAHVTISPSLFYRHPLHTAQRGFRYLIDSFLHLKNPADWPLGKCHDACNRQNPPCAG